MTDSKYSECLAHDAQLVIDSIPGSIIQIDLDRCFARIKNPKKKKKKMKRIPGCLQELETITESMISRKKYLYGSAESNSQNRTVDRKYATTGGTSYSPLKYIDMIDMARNHGE